MSQSPTLQELLTASNQYTLSNIYTSIPGIVVSVENMGEGRINVQPTVNIRDETGEVDIPRPPILNVLYQQPCSFVGGLTYPVKVGQTVWLNFSMRGLEVWKRGDGTPAAPADMRTFDPRDCKATSLPPFNMSPNLPSKRTWTHSTDDVVLVHNIGSGNEVEIRLKPDGGVVINSPTKVEVNCDVAEVNAESSTTVNTDSFSINSSSFSVNSDSVEFSSGSYTVGTGTYGVTATDSATMAANFNQTGSYVLNGIRLETHRHVETQSITEGPIN